MTSQRVDKKSIGLGSTTGEPELSTIIKLQTTSINSGKNLIGSTKNSNKLQYQSLLQPGTNSSSQVEGSCIMWIWVNKHV